MKHFAPKGMHYEVLEIDSDGTEYIVYYGLEMQEASSVLVEVWKEAFLKYPSRRVSMRCVDD